MYPLVLSLSIFVVAVMALLAVGPSIWGAVRRHLRAEFDADLRADHAAIWSGWYETWCPGCRIFSIERTIICRFCDRELTILKDFGAIARGEEKAVSNWANAVAAPRRDATVMVDQARALQHAKFREQHVAPRRRSS